LGEKYGLENGFGTLPPHPAPSPFPFRTLQVNPLRDVEV